MNHRSVAYAVLRVTLGVVFFFFGFGKLYDGYGEFIKGMQEEFAKTWLPGFAVTPFAWVLPFIELLLGILLTLGLFTRLALLGAGILLIFLSIGVNIQGNAGLVVHNLIYSLAIFFLLYHADDNAYALDTRK